MWIFGMLGGCEMLEMLLVPQPVKIRMTFHRTYRDDDPRKSDVLVTGMDAEACRRAFEHESASTPSPMHTTACSELLYTPGEGRWDGTCTYYCEITGPL